MRTLPVDRAVSGRHRLTRWLHARVLVACAGLLCLGLGLAGCQTTGANDDAGGSASGGSSSAGGRGTSASVSSRQALPDSAEETELQRRARIRVELGSGYYQQRNLPVALAELRQAQSIDPTYAPTYAVLGLIYMDLGERDRAEASFQQGLRLQPDDSDLNNNYGWYLCQTDRVPQAIERFQRALRNPLYKTPSRPLRNAGICSLRIGDQAGAEHYFQQAYQVDPRDPVAMYQLSDLYLKRKNLERARFYQQRLLSGYDPTPEVLWLALRIERTAGNRDVEASYGSQLRRRFPQSRETALLLSGQYDN